ncbi:hypothetical protein BCU71_04130 [Vibrio lentus]|nr:hypothetical protein BCU71_04130 [Vibrio lentus]PMK69738.1 hypothetical protein BCT93_03765 [Vibrio lentus]
MGVIFFAEVEILWKSFAFWVCWVMAELWIRLVSGGLDCDLTQVLDSNKGYLGIWVSGYRRHSILRMQGQIEDREQT